MIRTVPLKQIASAQGSTSALPPARWYQFLPRITPGFVNNPDPAVPNSNIYDGLAGYPLEVRLIGVDGKEMTPFRVYDRHPVRVPVNVGGIVVALGTVGVNYYYYDMLYGTEESDSLAELTGPLVKEFYVTPQELLLGANNNDGGVALSLNNPRRLEGWIANRGPNPIEISFGDYWDTLTPPTIAQSFPVAPGEKIVVATNQAIWGGCAAAAQVTGAGTVFWQRCMGDY